MLVSVEGMTFVVSCTFEERVHPKGAGFRWDNTKKRWFTRSSRKAGSLFAQIPDAFNSSAVEALESMNAIIADSRSDSPQGTSIASPEGLKYLPYQEAGIEQMIGRKACLLADEAGTGKTIQIAGLINHTKPSSVLVICPASLRLNWRNELNKWLVDPYKVSFDPKEGDIVIVSYDSSWRGNIFSKLMDRHFDLVVSDEAHYVKNEDSKRSIAVLTLAKKAESKVFMTGTPVLNRPIEMFSYLNVLRPDLFPEKLVYAANYCGLFLQEIRVKKEIKKVWNMNGATNLDELNDILRSTLMIRRLKADVLPQLPKKIRQVIELPCDEKATISDLNKEKSKWEKLCQEYGFETAVDMLESTCGSPEFKDFAKDRHAVALKKVKMSVEHIKDVLESVDKLVVFAHHRDVVDQLYLALKGYNPVKLVGGMSDAEKDASVQGFQTNKDVRVFIGNVQAAGVGITLTAASNIVFVELTLVPGHMTQAEDRCVRIGAEADSVLIQFLVFEDSLDAALCKIPLRKQKIADAALD